VTRQTKPQTANLLQPVKVTRREIPNFTELSINLIAAGDPKVFSDLLYFPLFTSWQKYQ
jgi:hypothetical protein